MNECYYKWCYWHQKDEPFCTVDKCVASHTNLKYFFEMRKEELKISTDRAAKELSDELPGEEFYE
jgi:hypothetical protein